LEPYTEADRDYFFGRDGDRRVIAANLLVAPLTVLYGSSGVGKSSLLRAGVAPDLRTHRHTTVVVFSKWSSPSFLDELKGECVAAVGEAGASLDASLPLDELLLSAAAASKGSLLIILDQFEEYLLYAPADAPGDFESQFARTVNREDVDANILVSLREDWLSKLDRFRSRVPHLMRNAIHLRSLDAGGAEEAIRRPLLVHNERVGQASPMGIEESLVQAVIEQAQTNAADSASAGAGRIEGEIGGIRTPLLQLMMMRVWEEETRSGSTVLRRATLDRLGGARKIFTRHLDDVMNALSEPDRRISARVFGYLVTPTGSKIAQRTEDLVLLAEADPVQTKAMLESLSRQRILCRLDRPERYEIFHDVLAPAILDWRGRYEKRRQAVALRRLRFFTTLLALYFIGTVTAIVIYRIQTSRAEERQRQSLSRELALTSIQKAQSEDPELGLLLALHALRIRHTPEAETALNRALALSRVRATLSGHAGPVNRAAVSPDGTRLVTASADKTLKLWDAKDGRNLLTFSGHLGPVADAAFSFDGSMVASVSEDGNLGIWDAASGGNLRMLPNGGAATAVAFSPTAPLVAAGSENGAIKIWEARDGKQAGACVGHSARIRALAFGPDGKVFASAGNDRSIRLWDPRSGKQIAAIGDDDEIWSLSFSPDGKHLLSSGVDGVLKRWRVGSTLRPAPAPTQPPVSLDLLAAAGFSPAGDRVATGGWDHTARVFDAASGQELYTLRGHTGPVSSVPFAPDGARLITSSADSTVKIWDIAPGPESLILATSGGALLSAAFSPDGSRIAAGGANGQLHIWNLSAGKLQVATTGGGQPLSAITFSPDGQRMATSSMDHSIQIREATLARPVGSPLRHNDSVMDVAFSPDGRLLATASWDGATGLWSASSGEQIAMLRGHKSGVNGVAFSPDSTRLATASLDGSAKVWDIASRRELVTFTGHNGRVFDVAFSPDGSRIATVGEDGEARIWNAATGAVISRIFAHNSWAHSVAFSPDGANLLTSGRDGIAKLWSVTSSELWLSFSGNGRKLFQAVFSPDGSRLATVGEDGVLRVHRLRITPNLPELIKLGRSRVTRSMTVSECRQYLHDDACLDVRQANVQIPSGNK